MPGCSQTVPSPQSLSQRTLHLLVVENVTADLERIVAALESAKIPFTYEVVDTLKACQTVLPHQAYDAVLSTFQLTGFTAYQVLELLQQSGQEIPFILVAENLGEEAAVECIKAGMTDYILKERLFRLPAVLERSRQECELRRQQQAAIAQSRRQAWREAIISRIVQAMHETLVLDELLQTTVETLREALQIDRCLIILSDANQQMIVYSCSSILPEPKDLLGSRCKFHQLVYNHLLNGETVSITDTDTGLVPEIQDHLKSYQVRSLLSVPLKYQQSHWGVISVQQCDHARQWTADEQALVQAIADQCAIAIHQAQLFEQVQQQAQQETLLNQISQTLNSSLDPTHILQEIVRLTGQCVRVDRVFIFALELDQICVVTEWLAGSQVPSMIDFRVPIQDWPDLLNLTSSFYAQRVYHAPNFAEVPPTPAHIAQQQDAKTLSVLSVPIFIRNELFGGLCLNTTTAYRTFTDHDIHVLQRIADQAAIALYNAQSYERLEQLVKARTQELEEEKFLSDAANRTKSEFLANMSHELRTPLTGILGFSSLLLKQIFGDLNPKQQQYLTGIHSCGEHLLELINDLLDLTKIEAGREELILESVPVSEVCEAGISLVREIANNRGLQVSWTIAPGIETCIADRRRLRQILFNLLSNAVKFTNVGSVRLDVTQTEDSIQFAVTDTGIGISVQDQTQLFQPFQQLDTGLDKKYQGTGLGLALARKLALLHSGEITVESQPEKGSCFTLHLPRQPRTA